MNFKLILYILGAVLVAGCKSAQVIEPSLQQLPASFQRDTARASISNISWREYFADQRLLGLIDTAIANNLDLMIANQRIEQSKAGVQSAKGALLPVVNGGGVAAVRRYGLYTMDGAGNST